MKIQDNGGSIFRFNTIVTLNFKRIGINKTA